MADGSRKWYIDTLDGRGGLAFASWRTDTLDTEPALLSQPTYYFSPPAFTPIPVANSATALAAERFGFQLGLFDDDGEVPFDSIAEVAEFVRRVYLGSGRSDGTDGGPVVPIVPPTGEPPDSYVEFEVLPEGPLGAQAKQFDVYVKATQRGSAKQFLWNLTSLKHQHLRSSLLARGAALTLIEMLGRFPRAGHGPELQIWETAASRLATVLIGMGGMGLLYDSQLVKRCRTFAQSAAPVLGLHWPKDADQEHPVECTLLAMLNLDWRAWWLGPQVSARLSHAGEPLDDLTHFPINKALASAILSPDPLRTSVAELVSSMLASPSQISQSKDIEAILTFAAARIVSYQAAPWEAFGQVAWWSTGAAPRGHAHRDRLEMEASKWLESELPRLSFSPSLEQMIQTPPSVPSPDAPVPAPPKLRRISDVVPTKGKRQAGA